LSHIKTVHPESSALKTQGTETKKTDLFSGIEAKDLFFFVLWVVVLGGIVSSLFWVARRGNAVLLHTDTKPPESVVTETYFTPVYVFFRQYPLLVAYFIFVVAVAIFTAICYLRTKGSRATTATLQTGTVLAYIPIGLVLPDSTDGGNSSYNVTQTQHTGSTEIKISNLSYYFILLSDYHHARMICKMLKFNCGRVNPEWSLERKFFHYLECARAHGGPDAITRVRGGKRLESGCGLGSSDEADFLHCMRGGMDQLQMFRLWQSFYSTTFMILRGEKSVESATTDSTSGAVGGDKANERTGGFDLPRISEKYNPGAAFAGGDYSNPEVSGVTATIPVYSSDQFSILELLSWI